jgi:hypothetical protein
MTHTIRRNEDGTVDEICVESPASVHIEQMTDSLWSVVIDGLYLSFGAKHGKAHVVLTVVEEPAKPVALPVQTIPVTTQVTLDDDMVHCDNDCQYLRPAARCELYDEQLVTAKDRRAKACDRCLEAVRQALRKP